MTRNHRNRNAEEQALATAQASRFAACFPEEYRTFSGTQYNWKKLHEECLVSALSGLNEQHQRLFSLVRSQHTAMPQAINDDAIESIYNAFGVKDGLGYELLTLCNQDILDRIFERFSPLDTDPGDMLTLSILCNKSHAAETAVNRLFSYGNEFDSQLVKAINIASENGSLPLNILPEAHQIMSRFIGTTLLNHFSDPKGIVGFTTSIPYSHDNPWHMNMNGDILQNPLQLAVKYGRTTIVELLINHGALVDIDGLHRQANPEILPPQTLSIAAEHGQFDMVNLLRRHRAKLSGSILSSRLFWIDWEDPVKRDDALDCAITQGRWDMCERLLEQFPDTQTRMEDSLIAKAHYMCTALCCDSAQLQTLQHAVRNLCNHIATPNVNPKMQLMAYVKTIDLIRNIKNSKLGQYTKESIISDFHTCLSKLLPGQSTLMKAVIMVTAAAAGFALGATAAIFLAGLGIPAVILTGTACAAGAGLFAYSHSKRKDTVANVCEAAKQAVISSLTP